MRFFSLMVFSLFVNNLFGQAGFQEYRLTDKTVISISPDSVEIEKMKKELGDDFYTVADDAMYYRSKTYQVIDSLNLKYIHTDRALIRLINNTDTLEIDTREMKVKWGYIYYNGSEIKVMDVFEILDLYQFYR